MLFSGTQWGEMPSLFFLWHPKENHMLSWYFYSFLSLCRTVTSQRTLHNHFSNLSIYETAQEEGLRKTQIFSLKFPNSPYGQNFQNLTNFWYRVCPFVFCLNQNFFAVIEPNDLLSSLQGWPKEPFLTWFIFLITFSELYFSQVPFKIIPFH